MNEQKIINRIKEGDRKELENVYNKYRNEFIVWVKSKYNIQPADAKDIYQQSILLMYENIVKNKYRTNRSKLKTYLFAIGKNLVHEQSRKTAKNSELSDFLGEEIFGIEEDDFDYREVLLNAVSDSLIELGDPCKSLLELCYYHQKTMEDISQNLKYKNSATAKNLKYKCLQRLRKIFNNEMSNKERVVYD